MFKEHALAACNIKQQNKYQVKASNLSTLIELVAGKMGSTLVPQIALHQLIKPRKKLRALPLDEPGPHRDCNNHTPCVSEYKKYGDT